MADNKREEISIFAERYMQFLNLWTVYNDLISGRYVPSLNDAGWPVGTTMMFLLYGYFYSLIEDSEEGINAFRIWREKYPDEETAIAAVESQVIPFRPRLKLFRNRIGFHGSRTRAHELSGFVLFAEHTGGEILNAMKNFKALAAALFAKDLARRGTGQYNQEQVRQQIDEVSEHARQNVQASRNASSSPN